MKNKLLSKVAIIEALVIFGLMLLGLSGCNNQSSADTESILNKPAALKLVNDYFKEYPHALLEERPNDDLEWYYPAEKYRQNIKVELHELKITDVGQEKDNFIPFKVDLLASVLEHKNIDYYPGILLKELPEKFTRVRIFYYGNSDVDKPFIKDIQGRTIYTN